LRHNQLLLEKIKESLASVLPITAIVLIISITVAPLTPGTMVLFLFGAVLLVVGMGLFTLGVDMSMIPMGDGIGVQISKARRVVIPLVVCFVLGFVVTMAEPDLQVLAEQLPSVPNMTLILVVAVGVGFFLVVAQVRMLLNIPLSYMLVFFYLVVFALSFFVPESFVPAAFDSGGVTTGPMTVPFILSLGVGVSAIRSDPNAENDSFGLVALSSVGPILAVMLLGLIYRPDGAAYGPDAALLDAADTLELSRQFAHALPEYLGEVAIALAPIAAFFAGSQLMILHLPRREVLRIAAGLLYTYVGLALFLTGVNVGFMPMGNYLGQALAGMERRWLLVPLGMLMGYFVVSAEPAVHVLSRQVYELTAGAIPPRALGLSLSVGVSVSVGLAMLRILTGVPILWLLAPGYAVALVLMPFVPPIFTSIAFDSGGVASGPMTATFLLPMAMGACAAVGGDMATDAFGVVAMVAMTPLITLQVLGLVFKRRQRKAQPSAPQPEAEEIIE